MKETKFKYSAFIRKNTPELRKKLEELGYENNIPYHISFDCLKTYQNDKYNCLYNDEFYINDNTIDCGENEEAFLAIAAIRTDTDKGKWFVLTTGAGEGDIIARCSNDKIGDSVSCREATPEEIINYFNNK